MGEPFGEPVEEREPFDEPFDEPPAEPPSLTGWLGVGSSGLGLAAAVVLLVLMALGKPTGFFDSIERVLTMVFFWLVAIAGGLKGLIWSAISNRVRGPTTSGRVAAGLGLPALLIALAVVFWISTR